MEYIIKEYVMWTLAKIYYNFRTILRGFLEDFVNPVSVIGDKIVDVAVKVYQRIAIDLLPTPDKSHYVFNLRDLSKCIQGVMQADPASTREPKQILRWI